MPFIWQKKFSTNKLQKLSNEWQKLENLPIYHKQKVKNKCINASQKAQNCDSTQLKKQNKKTEWHYAYILAKQPDFTQLLLACS